MVLIESLYWKKALWFLDSAKFDSNEEDSASVFSPSFGLKQTDKVPSKTVAAKKGMYLYLILWSIA